MSSLALDRPRRLTFSSGRVEQVLDFCLAHGSPYDRTLLRRLLLDLTSEEAGVVMIGSDEELMLVGAVIDRALNGEDAAHFEVLGVGCRMSAAQFSMLALQPAVTFARAGARRVLEASLHPLFSQVDEAERAFLEGGFVHTHDVYRMRRSGAATEAAPLGPLPEGWRWTLLEDGTVVDRAHEALWAMFQHAAGFSLSPLSEFRSMVASRTTTWRVLLDGDSIAGLVQVFVRGRCGELRTLGRAPAYRGRGLGAHLVREGLRVLLELGVAETELEVGAANEQALTLYRQFGFEVIVRTPIFTLALR